ncbi:PAS domain S-box protein [Ammoniphilus sp. 3BR4]|uniref:PAS domain S-box protein n=1 Tax=Ammoniphilus sp. 3BR4 TaxID=3158265 RepID=UPI003465A0D2
MDTPPVDAFEILERIKDGFFALDEYWKFTYVNAEASRLLFRSRDDLIGKHVWSEFPDAIHLPFYEWYHKAVCEQAPVTFDAFFPPLKTWFDVRAYPSENGLSVYFQDVTKKKMAVAQKEEHYQSLFQHNPDAVFSFDLDGNYLSVNPAMVKLLGYSEEELLQQSFIPLVPEDDLERTIQHYRTAANGMTQRYQTKAIHKNGRIVHVDVANMPIIVDDEVVGVYGIAKDITERIAEQESLRQSEELFQLISENSRDIISITSPEGRISYVSPSIRALLGYEPEEVIGSIRYDFWHPDDAKEFKKGNLTDNANEDILVRRIKHKNGHYVWIETSVKTRTNEQGEKFHAIGISRDITDRKLADDELRKAKDRLQSLVMNNADAIWVIDMEDRVLEINPAFETLFDWSAEDVLGRKLPIVPDFLKESIQHNHERVKKGISMAGIETIRQRRDGSLLDVSAALSPIVDSQGRVVGITGTCRDITPRKKVEDRLKEKTKQLESFIENMVDAILVFDMEGTILRTNRAFEKTFGWTKQEIIGLGLKELPFVPSQGIDEVMKFESEVKKGNSIIGAETIHLRKDGSALNVQLSISPINDVEGQMDGWSITLRDITEWKKSQEILKHTEKLSVAGQLAAGIAHEIRNPITAIKGFVQLMKSGVGNKTEYFDIMSSEIERIEQILSELLMLAKPQISKFERKEIKGLLAQVITLLDTQAILNNVEMVSEFQTGDNYINCDENQLKQVFINYIKNAIEAMPTGGKLVIQTRVIHDDQIAIRFIDEGVGMPEEVRAKLGQPFFTTKEKGTGLGYMVSKEIIENHWGEVHIMSEVNLGTTIEVIFPLAHEGKK